MLLLFGIKSQFLNGYKKNKNNALKVNPTFKPKIIIEYNNFKYSYAFLKTDCQKNTYTLISDI